MAFQPAPNTMQMEIRCTSDGQNVEWVFHFEQATTPTAADCAALANIGDSWMGNDMLPILSDQVLYRETYVRSLNSASAPEAVDNTNGGEVGGLTSPNLPNNVSWAVKFNTGLTGRSYRGRKYMFGLTESNVANSSILQTPADNYVTAFETLITAALGADFTMVVLSRVQGGVVLANAIGAPVLTVGYTDLVIDSQRRRLPGRGQ